MPVQYEGIKAEHEAVRNHAGLFDVSHMGEAVFSGPEAEAAVQRLVTRDVSRLDVGQAGYCGGLLRERGHGGRCASSTGARTTSLSS